MNRSAADRLIVALDVDGYDSAASLVEALAGKAAWFKIGSVLFTREGPRVCKLVKDSGAKLFLDLKYHDIPNTVAGAVRSAVDLGVDMMTLHASGGPTMLRAAVEAREHSGTNVIMVGVTVLTHFDFDEFLSLFQSSRSPQETVPALAAVALEAGLDGVVASARELSAIRKQLGQDLIVVTPGIRLPDAAKDDQTRVVTPGQAVRDGATFLVVGRPIIAAPDPVAACQRVLDDMTS